MNPRRIAAVLPLLGFFVGKSGAEEIRRWTDSSGRVHFSNVGPAEATEPPQPPPSIEPAPESEPQFREPEESSDPYGSLTDDQFSALVTRKREALRRELRDLRMRARAIDSEVEELRRARERAFREYGQKLQGVNRAPESKPSEREQELLEEKEKLRERARAIRKEFEEISDSARRRYGSLPGWWLPLD